MRNMQIIELTGDLYHMKAQHAEELQQLRQGSSCPMQDLATMLRLGKTQQNGPKPTAAAPQPITAQADGAAKAAKSSHSSQAMPTLPAHQLLTSDTSSNADKADSKDFLGEILGNLDFGSDSILPSF